MVTVLTIKLNVLFVYSPNKKIKRFSLGESEYSTNDLFHCGF